MAIISARKETHNYPVFNELGLPSAGHDLRDLLLLAHLRQTLTEIVRWMTDCGCVGAG
jgi:hypothetical protein